MCYILERVDCKPAGIFPCFFIEVKMAVSTTTNKVSYIGNGIAASFAIPFPFLENEHLKVYQLLNDIQTERTDWTVSGGNMVFDTAPANDAQIVIMREVPLTQETDYRENEILPAETLERNFDKLTMQVQQLKEQADRAVTVDIFDNTDAASLIPSIRQAVSDAAEYAAISEQNAQTASDKSDTATNKAAEVSNALLSKANTDLSNCTRPYIAETYHNGTEWYRLWSDGFIEQGGKTTYVNSNTRTLNLLKPFSSAIYSVVSGPIGLVSAGPVVLKVTDQQATYFQCVVVDGQTYQSAAYWEAKGY